MSTRSLSCKVIVIICLSLRICCSCRNEKPADYIDPFICTQGDHGQWLPAALVPFGLIELCPDTWPGSLTSDGDFAHSGYDWSDDHIRGFSHLHKGSSGGTTVHDRAGLISIVPFSDAPGETFFQDPVLTIDKSTEKAEAGYYSVYMPEQKILAELSAKIRTGIHRYTFTEKEGNHIFLYEGNRSGTTGISCSMVDDKTIEGSIGNKYFVIRFNSLVTGARIWNGSTIADGSSFENLDNGGMICRFDNLKNKTLIIKVGVSLSSIESARKNLDTECQNGNFEKVRRDAAVAWNKIFSSIEVKGNNIDDKKIFYTAL